MLFVRVAILSSVSSAHEKRGERKIEGREKSEKRETQGGKNRYANAGLLLLLHGAGASVVSFLLCTTTDSENK